MKTPIDFSTQVKLLKAGPANSNSKTILQFLAQEKWMGTVRKGEGRFLNAEVFSEALIWVPICSQNWNSPDVSLLSPQ